MEVDGVDNWNINPSEGAKFANLKAFGNAAREFEATHSESAINLMTRYLGVSVEYTNCPTMSLIIFFTSLFLLDFLLLNIC